MSPSADSRLPLFERYLTLWVLLCIVGGILLGSWGGAAVRSLASWQVSGVNIPVAVLIWMMIFPMMASVDFTSLREWRGHLKGLSLTVTVNWLVKPFTMALLAWLFFDRLYAGWISPEQADQYLAGAILLGAAPCTAMVFVWSYLSKGDPNYTLVQVSVNDMILLVAFVPIVQLLLGISDIRIPWDVLVTSVVTFVVIPLAAGYAVNRWLVGRRGLDWYRERFLPRLKPWSVMALLATLVLLFAFQGERILAEPLHILWIAVPLTIQTYLIFFLSWKGGRWLGLPYRTCAPSAMIGASNFFELAVAVAIVVFGLDSGAALATVVGVLIEVPVMLSLVALAKRWQYGQD